MDDVARLGPPHRCAHRNAANIDMRAPPNAGRAEVGHAGVSSRHRVRCGGRFDRQTQRPAEGPDRLQAFLPFRSAQFAVKELTVAHLKPFRVQEWIDAMPHASGTMRNYVRAVKRALA